MEQAPLPQARLTTQRSEFKAEFVHSGICSQRHLFIAAFVQSGVVGTGSCFMRQRGIMQCSFRLCQTQCVCWVFAMLMDLGKGESPAIC